MFEGVRERRSKWFDYDVNDEQSCLKAIRNGGIAALFSAVLTAIIAIVAMNTKSDDPTVAYILDPWIMVDAVLLAVLGFFVFRKSRVAATILLVYFTISKIMMWIEIGAPKGLFVSALFFMVYLTAARATFSWHSTYRDDPGHVRPTIPAASPNFGLIVGLYTCFFALLAVLSAISLPDHWMVWRAEGGALFFVDVAIALISLIAGAALVALILLRHRMAPTIARLYFFGRGFVAAVVVIAIAILTDFPSDPSQTGPVWFNLAMLVFCAAGFVYWNRSRKVRNLFALVFAEPAGGAMMPRFSPSVPIPAAPPSVAAESPRRGVATKVPISRTAEQNRLDSGAPSFDAPRMRICYVCGYRSSMESTNCVDCGRPLPGIASSGRSQ